MPDRQQMIERLTKRELAFLLEDWQPTPPGFESPLDRTTKFFADGGFTGWSDEQLQYSYEQLIEENENA